MARPPPLTATLTGGKFSALACSPSQSRRYLSICSKVIIYLARIGEEVVRMDAGDFFFAVGSSATGWKNWTTITTHSATIARWYLSEILFIGFVVVVLWIISTFDGNVCVAIFYVISCGERRVCCYLKIYRLQARQLILLYFKFSFL